VTAGPESRWARLIAGGGSGARDRLALAGLRALSIAYGGALRLHLGAYRVGLARRARLPALVISVGNITVGGTGKTTAAIAIARWLSDRGRRVAVLSRGYRGSAERGAVVVSEGVGPVVGPEVAGDEPYLISRALPGVSVLVGKDRRRTGRLAVERFGAEALVLDDGLQYQRLNKDVEIALVDALAPFGYDFLIPRGLLREPAANLARADAIWITHSDLVREKDLRALRERIEGCAPKARLWETRHAPVRLYRPADGAELPAEAAKGRRVVALSGIGNPTAFRRTLEQMGAVLVDHLRFPDHYPYQASELGGLLACVGRGRRSPPVDGGAPAGVGASAKGGPPYKPADVEMIVTTSKDAVRMPLECLGERLWVLEVELAERPGGAPLCEELAWLLTASARA
jgi:tetraacyldisaccharide 4'-kinase